MLRFSLPVLDPCIRKIKYFTRDCQIPGPRTRSISRACVVGVTLLVLSAIPGYAEQPAGRTSFERAERYFLEDKPAEARDLFEEVLRDHPENARIYLYLGIVYEQLGNYRQAIEIMTEGLGIPGAAREMLLFNIGNNYLRLENREKAIEFYGRVLDENPRFAQAYLNRANLRVRERVYQEAVEDYRTYLRLEPRTSQRSEIERMIALLRDTLEEEERFAAEEQRRLEQERIAEERRRIEEEQRRLAAEQRRRELLDSVLDSLGGSGREGRSVSAPSEDIMDMDDTFDIAD